MAATPHTIEEYVRWSDVDFARIMCYGAYLRFFEIAETELFRAAGLAYSDGSDRYGVWFPRAVIHSELYHPARLDDRLRVAAYVARVGTKSLTLNFDVLPSTARQLNAAGYQVLACVARETLEPRALPPGIVEALRPLTLTQEAARTALGVAAP